MRTHTQMNKTGAGAPKIDRNLLQVRLTGNEKRNIKMMAADSSLSRSNSFIIAASPVTSSNTIWLADMPSLLGSVRVRPPISLPAELPSASRISMRAVCKGPNVNVICLLWPDAEVKPKVPVTDFRDGLEIIKKSVEVPPGSHQMPSIPLK